MVSIHLQKVGTNALIFIHVTFCFCSILLFNVLSGFVSSTRFISEYMKINVGASFAFLAGALLITNYLRRFTLNLRESTILKGLCISVGIWTFIVVITTIAGFFHMPVPVMNIVYSPLYAVIYFDEWMTKIFSVNMGQSLSAKNAILFIVFTFVYQLCYSIVPTSVILILHRFTRKPKIVSDN